ncbi:MAG: TatD family hydrolase [Gammaproteobacteria bacterium]|nr:TatD family hydrolase [Gammaproteobacteria bacterium]
MQFIDTHCHCDFSAFDSDRDEILQHCRQAGLSVLIVPATQAATWGRLLSICAQHAELYPALGLHPMFTAQHQDDDLDRLAEHIEHHHPLAIGEIGLDFYHKSADRDRQIVLLEHQLILAQEFDLPVIMHVRKAHDQVIALLKKKPPRGGIIHAFNGSLQQAKQYIELGFKLGFGGTLTYPDAHKIHRLAREIAIENIVLETDAPDMSPFEHRGERNSPEYLIESLRALALLRQEDPAIIAAITTRNARDVFNLW